MKQNDLDKLFDAAKNGNTEDLEKLGAAAASKLSESQKNAIEKAMADPEYLKSVLASTKAQEILKKLQGGEK